MKRIVGMACILLCSVGLSACGTQEPKTAINYQGCASACAKGEICRADGRCSAEAFEVVYDIPAEAFEKAKSVRVVLPIRDLPSELRILWGDEPAGAKWNVIKTKNNAEIFHDYNAPGTYHVKLLDSAVSWGYIIEDDAVHSCPKHDEIFDGRNYLNEVVSFGSIRLGENAFIGTGLKILPKKDIPDATKLTTLKYAFACTEFNQPISFDTRSVTDMAGMFHDARSFNQAVSFDTRNVTNMKEMFSGAESFNQAVNFDTSNVNNMSYMFSGAESFNQPVNFNTSKVTNMSGMFSWAKSFNQPVNFDTSNVTDMLGMFGNAVSFNQPVNFDTRSVKYMDHMFSEAESFNQPVNFDTRNVERLGFMFARALSFNQPVNFDTRSVMSMNGMFYDAELFSQPVNFDTSNVTDMKWMFKGAKSFLYDSKNACDYYKLVKSVHNDITEEQLFGTIIGCD